MKKGFTLVEIMIVVAIIALLVAIAIPNIAAQRRTANNTAAAGTMRTLATAIETFNTATGMYPALITDLIPAGGGVPYISRIPTSTGTEGGYIYTYNTINTTGYTITTCPAQTTTGIYCWEVLTGGSVLRCGTEGVAATCNGAYSTQY